MGFFHAVFYSLLSASIGFRLAAFTEGSNPKITPIIVENSTEPIIAGTLIAVGAPETLDTTLDKIIPKTTPMIPPMLVSMEASVRN